ncbi:hypothetical protein B0A55_11512 [Friedmanniomyces simplex]|uniref:Amino acid transporter transmembrane domain-containing protein n=1 Tax=Friedmanniomyces simplex TaxID=329884 RepID=A0A4U0W7T0_9PEZI|nr:hypothetical protein B0A55_11512 [Friedmanniomyces simplex]
MMASSNPPGSLSTQRDNTSKTPSSISVSVSQEKPSDVERLPTNEATIHEGTQNLHRLGWKRLTICLIVEAIALGSLSTPSAFATLGMLAAILLTIVAAGISAHSSPGGLNAVDWSLWPPADLTFHQAFLATTNIVFAYSFAVCQFTFMAEMHTPKDYVKSICALGVIEIVIYTLLGAIVYAFVGSSVSSPALLSTGHTVSRVAFGIALPVIFISGAINSTVVAKFLMGRAFGGREVGSVDNWRGSGSWCVWISLIAFITVVSWVVAEAVPFFNALLGLISSLFISSFSLYFPSLFWFCLIKQGKWNASR